MQVVKTLLAIFSAVVVVSSVSAAPPPPPPPPSPAMQRLIDGHDVARLFDDYRRIVGLRLERLMRDRIDELISDAGQPWPTQLHDDWRSTRSVDLTQAEYGRSLREAPEIVERFIEFCPASSVQTDQCEWTYVSVSRMGVEVAEASFDAEAAVSAVRRAGITPPVRDLAYPEAIVDAIDGPLSDGRARLRYRRISSRNCSLLYQIPRIFDSLPDIARDGLQRSPVDRPPPPFIHVPVLRVQFQGRSVGLVEYSGHRQSSAVGEMISIVRRLGSCSPQ